MEGSTVVESYDYSPWGLLLAGRALVSSAPTRELFTGQEYDASTQLYYFGARYYMPAIGRWMSVDPSADALPGWSAYNYVLNNPGSTTDPTGMFPIFGEEIYGTNGTVCTGLDSYECAARYGRASIDDADEAAKAAKLDETAGNTDPFGLNPCLVPPVAAICWRLILIAGTAAVAATPGFADGAGDALAAGATAITESAQRAFSRLTRLFSSGSRSLDDPGSLQGASPGEIQALIPEGWVSAPTAQGGGIRYYDPSAPGEQVRVMPGNPNAQMPVRRGPYVRVSRHGTVSQHIPLEGNPEQPE